MSEAMSRKLEGVNMGFLRQIMGQRAVRRKERNWRQVAAEKVLEKAGTHSLGAYTDRRQTTVAEWVELRPILEVCDRDTSYKGRGRCREPWWRQTADRKYLSARLKEIPEAARERRWKSGRHGGGGIDRDAEESEDGAGIDRSRDAGTETGDSQVGK